MTVNKDALKYYRKKCDLSQNDMSNKLEISLSLYQSFEQGRRNPSNEVIERIADILNIEKYSILNSCITSNIDLEIDNKINVLADKQIQAKKLISELKQFVEELERFVYKGGGNSEQ